MIRLLITIGAVLFALLFPSIARDWQAIGFLAVVATVGMAHGSLDHLVENKAHGKASLKELIRFYGSYLLVAGAVGIIWWLNSSIGLVLFLLTSAYHFGQSELRDHGKNQWVIRLMRTVWGSGLIILPAVFHAQSFSADLATINIDIPPARLQALGTAVLGLSGIIYLSGLLSGLYNFATALKAGFAWIAYGSILVLSPPLWGIAIYFGVWHAWPALETLAEELRLDDLQSWIRALAPNYLTSLLAMSLWVGFGWNQGMPALITGILILLSALTVPHIYVFERIYRD